MPVTYDSELLRPAPFVSIQKAYIRGPDGNVNNFEYVFTLSSSIVNVGTAQNSPGATIDGMQGILGEQARIRELFVDGKLLEIEAPDGLGDKISAYCTVDAINFNEGVWVNRCEYTVTLRAKSIIGEVSDFDFPDLDSYGESWNVNENEDGTYTVSHQIQAKGALIHGPSGTNDPLLAAKTWVVDRMYINDFDGDFEISSPPPIMSFGNLVTGSGNSGTGFWNKSIAESVDPYAYTWSITENFIYLPSGSVKEEWSSSVSFETDNPRKATVTVAGTVYGYATNAKDQDDRLTRAKDYFASSVEPNLSTRIVPYVPSGFTVNPIPSTKQYSYDTPGNVRYSYSFLTSNGGTIIANALDENITVSDTGPTDVFAQIPVPGRAGGPVVQDMNTVTLPERTVSITATIASSGASLPLGSLQAAYLAKPNTNPIVNVLKPSAGYYYIRQDSEEWNPIRQQYSRTTAWVIQPTGTTIAGMPSGIHNLP